jgi:multicomponent Na+:H+ antiporter subunit E
MTNLALNVLLAIVWMLIEANFSAWTLLEGLLLGFLSITILELAQTKRTYARWVGALLHLSTFFLVDLIKSNVVLARDILRPKPRFEPALLRVAITDLSPISTVVLTNLISLTPGTLTVDAEDDGRVIYVHALYAEDPKEVRRRIHNMESLVRRTAVGQLPPKEGL